MAQVDNGHEVPGATPQVLAVGSPAIGEILADRYQVEEQLNADARGRQLYRGMDVVLRRPVTIVLRRPGGDAAAEMLSAAVSASRVVHPHLVGVYDAIDEGHRAYVVREWIDGYSLKEAVAEGPMDTPRSVAITWAVADAVAALHASGVVHGNVHPDSVMIAQDGRVMLADARADEDATLETDLCAIGGVLYAALTGYWPHAEAGPAMLADGIHEDGRLIAPHEVRADVPDPIDGLAVGLLTHDLSQSSAAAVAAHLASMTEEAQDEEFEHALDLGAFDSSAVAPAAAPGHRRRLVTAIGMLVVLAVLGTFAATQLSDGTGDGTGSAASGTSQSTDDAGDGASDDGATGEPYELELSADQARIVVGHANNGDRAEVRDAELTVDGDQSTYWKTDHYNTADFGSMREGLGIWLDLGDSYDVANVMVDVSRTGATMELRGGDSDPGKGQATQDGDDAIIADYTTIDDPRVNEGTTVLFQGGESPVRYLLVWITNLPPDAGRYGIRVFEITVTVQ